MDGRHVNGSGRQSWHKVATAGGRFQKKLVPILCSKLVPDLGTSKGHINVGPQIGDQNEPQNGDQEFEKNGPSDHIMADSSAPLSGATRLMSRCP